MSSVAYVSLQAVLKTKEPAVDLLRTLLKEQTDPSIVDSWLEDDPYETTYTLGDYTIQAIGNNALDIGRIVLYDDGRLDMATFKHHKTKLEIYVDKLCQKYNCTPTMYVSLDTEY